MPISGQYDIKLFAANNQNSDGSFNILDELYNGSGIPKSEGDPKWNKNNKQKTSPFGASWSSENHDTNAVLGYNIDVATLPYINIKDPFNNKQKLKEACNGNYIVYIWTYLPTGICLVGSATSSFTRISDYFKPIKLLTETRLGMKFLRWFGFKDIQLSIIQLDYTKYTLEDVRTLEQFYIDNLHSALNIARVVSKARRKGVNYITNSYVESDLRDQPIIIYIYDSKAENLLYAFQSKTILYSEFGIHHGTLKILLNTNNLYLNNFIISTEKIETASTNNMLSIKELLNLKTKSKTLFLSNYNTTKAKHLILIDTNNKNKTYEFRSLNKASLFIKQTEGKVDKKSLRKYINQTDLYQKRWKIKEE